MDAFEAIKATFFQECDELLAELESKLMLLEQGQTDLETINAVFRAVHSVKGGAGAFGLEALVRFAHVFETLMDELRAGRKPCDTVTIKTLLRASDVLADHIQAAQGLAPPVDEERSAGLVHELELLTHGGEAPPVVEEDEDDFGFVPMAFDVPLDEPLPSLGEPEAVAAEAQTGWRILFKPHGRMYGSANEAGLLLRELGRLGPITVSVEDSALPTLDVLVAEDGYLTWTIDLTAAIEEKVVREVFDFVEADCDLTISPLGGGSEPVLVFEEEPPAVLPASDELDIAALLAKAAGDAPAVEQPTPDAVAPAPALEAVAPAPVPAPAAPAPAPAPVAAAPAPAAPIPPAQVAAPVAPAPVTIRVDLDRVDRLINVVGELVIQQAMLSQRVLESGLARSSGIALGLEDLELLTREIQDSVMAIRAQPVKSVFQRMPRLVREVADMVSKQVRLVTAGEDTEVDKTVVERLAEPITHMLRNAIDHGLETPDERIAAGKTAEGTVRLAALHRSGRIVIEISDDGRGINRERVKKIAIDKGLVAPDAALTDEQIDNLIFLPGFSTAAVVSDISGRGVGMDVVKRSIQALGGRISISSVPGKGSTFTLSLPLTLAVLDGMVVSAADQILIAPLPAIVESLTPQEGDLHYVGGVDPVIRFRDRFLPLIDVAMTMGFRDTPVVPSEGVAVVVETEGGQQAALLFDAIQGQRQVVIKSLETNYQQVEGIAAATILGDGRVALILDVDVLVTDMRRRSSRPDFKLAS
ncbi:MULTISPECIES: chemotaxis protein CheA [Brevundimonas]|jgi:two-component system, chemotaxis family, sensor kinase CheA|uniref:Chemotaxis protein CheA n=1 Tax=Brevundimonas mediterranea TaxID=74329 RepID=A0AB37E832_9CAUL|nr:MULTISPECIES: chemotaxis protein CheA [Brevundimonas]EDX82003.1 ATPase, histidine kinase-, DNA gyrase B-, and HSP90-like domain protein [Brevundimonas sp. BAL3]MBA4331800.1 chemotaxis protein CheA [Brevundimonas sp.]QIH73357.1 chemotaxis protein CheA [Brevundimonas mediterranea]TAJ39189.1 MAG: chemotaxis protein CheA [Brevundimonas sp.]